MTTIKQRQLPDKPHVNDPAMQRWIDAVHSILQINQGVSNAGVSQKTPTVQDMINAGIVNADKIT